MNTKWLYVAFASASFMALSIDSYASTYICLDAKLDAPIWVFKHLQEADVVVLGTVIFEETPEKRQTMPEPSTMKELMELASNPPPTDYNTMHYQSISFSVIKQWKGPPLLVYSVKNNVVPGQFGAPLKTGETYLIFGRKQEGGTHTISTVCGSTLNESSAQERIAALEMFAKAADVAKSESQ